VRIIGCHVQCADDCICLKTTAGNNEYGPTKNVIISNCTLTSTSAAIKIGTEGVADFENILVDNCIITGTNRGLSIQIRDGGCVRNVSFSNIMIETRRFAECWWGCAEPIVMTTHDRNANTHSGSIENVRFFNVTCKGENGVFLSGNEENHIKNVLFENVNVCLEATSKWERGMYDLRPIPPEKEGMLHQKSAAMFLRWVDGVTVRNSTLGFAGEDRSDFAQALLTQNCTNVQTMGLTAEAAAPEYQSIELG
jgi:polygalacturonase